MDFNGNGNGNGAAGRSVEKPGQGTTAPEPQRHRPVMLPEVLEYLRPVPGAVIVDATVGYGGHAKEIVNRTMPGGRLVGIDKDSEALAHAASVLEQHRDRVSLEQGDYAEIPEMLARLGIDGVDGILLDLGVSGPQLDEADRGFSYMRPGPLDMRMDAGQEKSATEVINHCSQAELADIIRRYGEERWASRIAAFIVQRRQREPITTTEQLVETVKAAIPASARRKGGHPARRTFQALRIEVNRELAGLEEALPRAAAVLKQGGRIVVISYHSLEDRIVKRTFAAMSAETQPDVTKGTDPFVTPMRLLTRKPVMPSKREISENPRARSAKLRAAERRA